MKTKIKKQTRLEKLIRHGAAVLAHERIFNARELNNLAKIKRKNNGFRIP